MPDVVTRSCDDDHGDGRDDGDPAALARSYAASLRVGAATGEGGAIAWTEAAAVCVLAAVRLVGAPRLRAPTRVDVSATLHVGLEVLVWAPRRSVLADAERAMDSELTARRRQRRSA